MATSNPFARAGDSTAASVKESNNHLSQVHKEISDHAASASAFNKDLPKATSHLVDQNVLPNTKIDFGHQGGSMIPLHDQMLAKAFGVDIKANKDGSFDVKSPLDQDPVKMAGKIGQLIMGELLGGGSEPPSAMPGFNPLFAAAWKGWDMPSPPPEPQPEPPQDPNVW